MYIKKSVLAGMIMVLGGIVLLAVAILFCFSEVAISGYTCMAVWMICLWLVLPLTKK